MKITEDYIKKLGKIDAKIDALLSPIQVEDKFDLIQEIHDTVIEGAFELSRQYDEIVDRLQEDYEVLDDEDVEIPDSLLLEDFRIKFPTKTSVSRLNEDKLVDLAIAIGISASKSDLKRDTLAKVLDVLGLK